MFQTRIGVSGWAYKGWRGRFYPKGLRQTEELQFASRRINTIEINGSFYALQKPESYKKWYSATPDDFIFTVKANRYITHIKKLKDVESAVSNFFASGVLALEEKLGPILWQLPSEMKYNKTVFEKFVQTLPQTMQRAALIAQNHTQLLDGRAFFDVKNKRQRVRHAIEVRNESFRNEEFFDLLKKHSVALVIADSRRWPIYEEKTADFIYIRLHGRGTLYGGNYSDKDLEHWAKRIKIWKRGQRDVYAYFNNDAKAYAPADAIKLANILKVKVQFASEK